MFCEIWKSQSMGKLRKNTAHTGGLGDLQTSNVYNKGIRVGKGIFNSYAIATLVFYW